MIYEYDTEYLKDIEIEGTKIFVEKIFKSQK